MGQSGDRTREDESGPGRAGDPPRGRTCGERRRAVAMRPMSNSSTRPTSLQRRDFLRAGVLAAAATALDVSRGESATTSSPAPTALARAPEKNAFEQNAFELEETTIGALQDGMRTGRY